ncbi:MAG: ATP-binding cassette, subfamily multidrug efflux pump [Chloroflexota bacterium]|nr:ATP-binding cassette, subfamily multidrug efflux pump [Chloroflexota bacterium]
MADSSSKAPITMMRAMRGGSAGHPGRIEKAKDARGASLRLAAYLKPYAKPLLVVFLLVLGYTLTGLASPYLMGRAIDRYIGGGDVQGLLVTVGLMAAAYLVTNGLQLASNWLMSTLTQKALKQLRTDLFSHLQLLSLSYYDHNPPGELMSRLTNDIDVINQAVSMNITSLIASVLSLVGILIAMFALDFWLATASLLVVPLTLWFTTFVAKYSRRGFRELQAELGELNGVIEETVSGQKVIKAFRRNQYALDSFQTANEAVYRTGRTAHTYAFLLMPLTNQIGNLFVITLAGLGGWLAIKGLVTVGLIATFISYGRQFIQPVRQLANLYNNIQSALAGAERVFEILDTQPEVEDAPDAVALDKVQGDVRFEHVNFSYVEGVPVIKDMSLHAKAGQTIALVGPTGAGKTTIINLLSRFYDVDSGCIRIDGIDICHIRKEDLRRSLGIVLQDTFLFSGTVVDNIRYGRLDASDEECIQAAKVADADYFIRQLPQGYQTQLSERGSNLSQGQRQLLAISRAVLADPGILILDEATSSVDTRTEAHIQKALLSLMEGRTSFVIAHRLSTIRDADNVLVIRQGEIIEQGSHQQLIEREGFYYNLYMSQFKGQAI